MTTAQHIVQGVIISYAFKSAEYFTPILISAIILSAAPDLVRFFRKDWSLYVLAHYTWYCYLIPFWNLHITEDYFVHNQEPPYGWKDWAYALEVWLWVVEIPFFITII